MNKKDKYIFQKCRFDERMAKSSFNPNLARYIRYIKRQIRENNNLRSEINRIKQIQAVNFKNPAQNFLKALKPFINSPGEEVSKTWNKKAPIKSVLSKEDLKPQRKLGFVESIAQEIREESIIAKEQVANSIKKSVLIHLKRPTYIPPYTLERLLNRKVKKCDRLRKILRKDVPSYKKKIASNKTIRNSNKYDFIPQFYKYKDEQKYIALKTFSFVFKGICELETTKRFCMWLSNHPEIEPPSYLLKNGFLNPDLTPDTSVYRNESTYTIPDINEDFIKGHFKKFVSFKILPSSDNISMKSNFISDVEIIV